MAVKLRERRPGEWWLYVDHQGKRFAKKLGHDKRVAKQIAGEVHKRLAAGDLGILPAEKHEPAETLKTYAERYMKAAAHHLKHSTWKDYDGNLRNHIYPELGERAMTSITRQDVKGLALKLRDAKLAPKTVRKVVGTLSTILTEALDDGELPSNPATQLRKVYRSAEFHDGDMRGHINPLSREELAHLLTTAETHTIERAGKVVHPYRPHRLFLLLLARTGVRLGEAIALTWGDVDLHGGFLEVRRNIVRGRVTTPKNRKSRRVDVSNQLGEELAQARQDRFGKVVAINPEAQVDRDALAGVADAWLFPDATGGPIDPDNFRSRVWEPLLTAAKLRKVRLHDLRHSYASLLLQDGVELLYVSQQLGHHDGAFTLKQYGHLMPRDRRGEVNRLDRPATIRNPDATNTPNDVSGEKRKAS